MEETAGKKKDLERRHIEDLLTLVENGTGKRISLPYNMVAEKNYQYIKVQKGNISDKQEMTGKILCEEVTDLTNIVENDCIKIIDYDRIETGVQLRCRKPGDFFTFGKDQKRKSLSRYFIDEKIPRQLREEIPLVADGSHIVWIVGRRISEYYKIKESTKRYLKLEFKREGDDSNGEYQSNDFRGRCNKRIAEMGAQISEDYAGKEIHLIAILKGSVFFACELAKRITIPVTIDFMSVSSYGNSRESSGIVKIAKDLDEPILDKEVLVVEDIIDSGKTLNHLKPMLESRNPASLHLCTLLSKPDRREVEVPVRYIGFEVPDEFVVGYGLDYAQKYRNLPYIGVAEEE